MGKFSKIGGGNKRHTSTDGRRSVDRTSSGKGITVTDHHKNGKSTSYEHSSSLGAWLFNGSRGRRR